MKDYENSILPIDHFVASLRHRLGPLWDERLRPSAKVFYTIAKAINTVVSFGYLKSTAVQRTTKTKISSAFGLLLDQWDQIVHVAEQALDRWMPVEQQVDSNHGEYMLGNEREAQVDMEIDLYIAQRMRESSPSTSSHQASTTPMDGSARGTSRSSDPSPVSSSSPYSLTSPLTTTSSARRRSHPTAAVSVTTTRPSFKSSTSPAINHGFRSPGSPPSVSPSAPADLLTELRSSDLRRSTSDLRSRSSFHSTKSLPKSASLPVKSTRSSEAVRGFGLSPGSPSDDDADNIFEMEMDPLSNSPRSTFRPNLNLNPTMGPTDQEDDQNDSLTSLLSQRLALSNSKNNQFLLAVQKRFPGH